MSRVALKSRCTFVHSTQGQVTELLQHVAFQVLMSKDWANPGCLEPGDLIPTYSNMVN